MADTDHAEVERRVHHDWDGDTSLTTTIVDAIAGLDDDYLSGDKHLYQRIDPDALERLFVSRSGIPRSEGRVSFPFGGCQVTVHASGDVLVRPRTGRAVSRDESA
ncbi:HalOD1 output domain-containing protein [Halosimplex halophilum]|uniref:HalOD1 output domain-containing protein n=1 Tax=Halosimplex halophilum TaxID=2559572 RepID=UPI00107F03E7|nr:HalOD1 output domain-containing protein [Halosimplex halophilum]